jgi:ComF family protein
LKEAIHRFKYMAEFSLLKVFGILLYSTFQTLPHECKVDFIVPVPLHIRRLRERGFNQALLLARALGKRTRIPCRERALRKIKDTPFQTVLQGRERRRNLKGAFHVENKMEIKGNSILLVDDVYTTGTTVNECSRTLLKEGAERVVILTLARAI